MCAVVKNARIYFDVDGEGSTPAGAAMVEKPTLMVLHGGPGSDHSYFKPWIRPVTEVAQVIYVDHRGNGRSELTGPATYNIDQIVDDLKALRRLLGLGRVQLLGHSFGGMVALTFALRHPGSLEALLLIRRPRAGRSSAKMRGPWPRGWRRRSRWPCWRPCSTVSSNPMRSMRNGGASACRYRP